MMPFFDDRERKMALLMLILFLIEFVLLVVFIPANNDVAVFFDQSQQFKDGTLFIDGAFSEYPPLAWAVILFPGLFTDDFQIYFIIFAGIDLVCMFLTGLLLMKICRGRTAYLPILIVVYITITMLYMDQAIFKFDIVTVLLMAISIYGFVNRRYHVAMVFAVLGASIKLFPVLLLPVFIIMHLREREELKRLLKAMATVFAVASLLLAVLLLFGVDSELLFGFITYQSDRGFHEESVFGTITVIICKLFNITTTYSERYHALDIHNIICDTVIGYWTMIMAAVLLITLCVLVYERFRMDEGKERFVFFAQSATILFLVFIMINKVFSTQFIQWLYPLFIMLLCYLGRRQTIAMSVVFIVIVSLSRIYLAISYRDMDIAQCILFFRDIVMIGLLVLLFVMIHRMGKTSDPSLIRT